MELVLEKAQSCLIVPYLCISLLIMVYQNCQKLTLELNRGMRVKDQIVEVLGLNILIIDSKVKFLLSKLIFAT